VYEFENRSTKGLRIMVSGENIVDGQQILERLARQGSEQIQEISVVTSPGARTAAWAVKVKSNSSYNFYNVVAVVIGDAGSIPVESFQQQGSLSAGTYAVMFRVGDKNVFHVKP